MKEGCGSRRELHSGGPLQSKEADNERHSNGESYAVGSSGRFKENYCNSPECGCLFTYVYYVVTSDGDDFAAPNAFKIPQRNQKITLGDVKKYFPLPGTYHFRVKFKVNDFPNNKDAVRGWTGDLGGEHHREQHQQPFVWLDFQDDSQPLPLYDQRIFVKATRLSWHSDPQTVGTAPSEFGNLGSHIEEGNNHACVDAEQQKKLLQQLQSPQVENHSLLKLSIKKETTRDSQRLLVGSGLANAQHTESHISGEPEGQRSHIQQLRSARASTSLSGADMLFFDDAPEDNMASTERAGLVEDKTSKLGNVDLIF